MGGLRSKVSARFACFFIRRVLFLSLLISAMYALLTFTFSSASKDDTPSIFEELVHLNPKLTLLYSPTREESSSSTQKNIPSGDTSSSSSNSSNYSSISVNESNSFISKGTTTIKELILEAAKTVRSIPHPPYILGGLQDGPKFYKNSSCARFPTIYDIEFSNSYWQTQRTSNGTLHLYSAYYDIRSLNRLGPSVRILGMMNRIEPNVTTFCQLWFSGESEPAFSRVLEYKYIWNSKWGNYKQGVLQPYLLACRIPLSHYGKIPTSVSVEETPCGNATNNVRVQFERPEKKEKFAVCVKGLDFLHEDFSVRLVEWIELLTLLGAHKIFLYELAVHPNVAKVLEYFKSTGQVDLSPLSLPGGQPNEPNLRHAFLKEKYTIKRQNELIPYNDCLYRNLYRYDYITLLDIDEVILPINGSSDWAELMDEAERQSSHTRNGSITSYCFRNVYFMDDMMIGQVSPPGIPNYFHMLQHVYRSFNYTKPGKYVKCFHDPERVITLHNHFPRACLNGTCRSYSVPTELAHLQHYRATCVGDLKNCSEDYRKKSVLDESIWRFKEPLMERATNVLRKLGFIPEIDSSTVPSHLETDII